ncbi:DNA polymerase Y family protein [uncultured Cohaesibacter sp.]|uniref:Y-family DNA polymerase n=1 Tax=uncultured Cohaesibacter sp. TaxID=1002546 RepID=UPI002930247E
MVAPFALTLQQSNAERIYCLNAMAEEQGVQRGMGLADARALCPDLQTMPANQEADNQFLHLLARWAGRFCPWVGLEGPDGLVLDVTGSTHLFGGEQALLETLDERLGRAGLSAQLALADTRGAAWALAHYGAWQPGSVSPAENKGGGVAQGGRDLSSQLAPRGKSLEVLGALPVAALRLDEKICTGLLRLGVRTIEALYALPRATLTRRFGLEPLMRLDQALGHREEAISPLSEAPHYGVRMSLPDPIGLADDVMAVTGKLLDRLCDKLDREGCGARILQLTMRRLDQAASQVELRLARPMREACRILPLFERGVGEVDAGFGIDMVRLEAVAVEPMVDEQMTSIVLGGATGSKERGGPLAAGMSESRSLDDLITRLGSRIGLENVFRFIPADSHIPERSFSLQPAAWSAPVGLWPGAGGTEGSEVSRGSENVGMGPPRPVRLFPPEAIVLPLSCELDMDRREPPEHFRWRRMQLSVARARGPERIAPEWWWEDPLWRSGIRDYWWVETRQGWRLWLFHTPQNRLAHLSSWFVQGEFA